MIPAIFVVCGIAYHALAILAVLRFRIRDGVPTGAWSSQPVSILKPVRGRDAGFYQALRSHALLEYPAGFELLFGVSDGTDRALDDIERLRQEFPALPIRIINTQNDAPNGKVGALEILITHASHGVILINDSDISVNRAYLSRVVSLLCGDVGIVTCLYRGTGSSIPSRFEAVGITTEFGPSVLVADLLSASHFAFGSTIAMTRASLNSVGGFAAVRNYLADDYQLGARVSQAGKRVKIADSIVETSLGSGSWREVWQHQIRWSRTIRVSNPTGYAGYLVTQLTFWSCIATCAGYWRLALAAVVLRMISAYVSVTKLGDRYALRLLWAVPLRDLFGTGIWISGIFGKTVSWRGLRFRLYSNGTIERLP